MKDAIARYTLKMPKGWEDQTTFLFTGPQIDGRGLQLMMVLDRHLQTTEIEEFARQRTEILRNSLQGIEVLKDEEITLEDGNPAWEFVYKWIPGDGVKFIQLYVFVIAERTGFSFSVQFSKKAYQLTGGQVREIIEDLVPGTYEPLEDE